MLAIPSSRPSSGTTNATNRCDSSPAKPASVANFGLSSPSKIQYMTTRIDARATFSTTSSTSRVRPTARRRPDCSNARWSARIPNRPSGAVRRRIPPLRRRPRWRCRGWGRPDCQGTASGAEDGSCARERWPGPRPPRRWRRNRVRADIRRLRHATSPTGCWRWGNGRCWRRTPARSGRSGSRRCVP